MDNVVKFESPLNHRLNWVTIIGVAVFHVLAVFALFTFSWTNLLAGLITWWIAGSLGIGLGYHRLLTHKGFEAPTWLKYVLATCGSLAVQAGPLAWVTTHRIHHAFTEQDGDPHSPKNGTYWSHIGWIFQGTAQNHDLETHQRYSPDLVKSSFLKVLDKYYWMTSVFVGIILFAIGGLDMLLWGIFARTVWGWHSTWLVNSATHLWGTRRFKTTDDSRNNGLIAMLSFGEGWHNNHHAYPRSSRHGLTWYELDINWIQIQLMKKVGLVWNVYAIDLKDENKPLRKAA